MKQTSLCICGPTASGKTSLALSVASLLPKCAIISADSRQSYKDLSILTGKDIPEKLSKNIRIYGVDLLNASESFNLALFVDKITPIIEKNLVQKTPVILVGGSGLYLKALTSKLSDIHIPPNPVLREKLNKMSLDELKNELIRINKSQFDKLNNSDVNNPRRLIRHIEKSLDPHQPRCTKEIDAHYLWVGLSLSKETQTRQIHKRILNRIDQGVIDEVINLYKKYPQNNFPIFSSLGVKEIISFYNKEITRDRMITSWTNSEVDYARRQMVRFKKQPNIIWYDEDVNRNELAEKLASILKNDQTQKNNL